MIRYYIRPYTSLNAYVDIDWHDTETGMRGHAHRVEVTGQHHLAHREAMDKALAIVDRSNRPMDFNQPGDADRAYEDTVVAGGGAR